MENISVQQLDSLVENIFKKKDEIQVKENELAVLNKELVEMKQMAVVWLKELNRDDYKTSVGSLSIKQRWRVGLPKTDADKERFFEHLRVRGIFEKYITVNSNSLNALFNSDWEAAKDRGEGMDFEMPGIEAPKLFEDLSIRKA